MAVSERLVRSRGRVARSIGSRAGPVLSPAVLSSRSVANTGRSARLQSWSDRRPVGMGIENAGRTTGMTLSIIREVVHAGRVELVGDSDLLTGRCFRALALSASSLVLFSTAARAKIPPGPRCRVVPGAAGRHSRRVLVAQVQGVAGSDDSRLLRQVRQGRGAGQFRQDPGRCVAASMGDRRGTTD